jgi:hypothetical protein
MLGEHWARHQKPAPTGTLVVGYVDRIEGDPSWVDPADHPRFAEPLRFGIDVAVKGGVARVFAGQSPVPLRAAPYRRENSRWYRP